MGNILFLSLNKLIIFFPVLLCKLSLLPGVLFNLFSTEKLFYNTKLVN